MTSFVVKALQKEELSIFSKLSDRELANRSAHWIRADTNPGYPCRVSLVDAEVGERVLAFSFCHHDVNSPYRSAGPIFIREKAETARLKINHIPKMLRHRLLSLRAYGSDNMMIGAEVLEGVDLEDGIDRLFESDKVEFLHIHNANPGCFNCAVYRA